MALKILIIKKIVIIQKSPHIYHRGDFCGLYKIRRRCGQVYGEFQRSEKYEKATF